MNNTVIIVVGIVVYAAYVFWVRYYLMVLDAHLRERVGARFGVIIERGSRNLWQVTTAGPWLRRYLIARIQVLFLLPALLGPLAVIGLALYLLGRSP
jgi:hypothetical protein